MFDRLAWRRELYERYLVDLDDEEESDDHDTPMGELARMADDVEVGRTEPSWPRS